MHLTRALGVALGPALLLVHAHQFPLPEHTSASTGGYTDRHHFSHPIRRVAVIGAGPNGLQAAAALIDHGFEVRLFERRTRPGGNWFYTDAKPVHTTFPNRFLNESGYIPDIPDILPQSKVLSDGDDGLQNDWRLREHWSPSPVWASLRGLAPPFIMSLPNVQYAPDQEWKVHHRAIGRHIRQYASSVGLNSNDEEHANVTSYSTRVERIRKPKGAKRWTLTLRKLEEIAHSKGKVLAEWWTEDFDAVVIATPATEAPWVPAIPHLDNWANAYPEFIYHSSEYRYPQGLRGKNVLIIGASVSAYGIAADLVPFVGSLTISVRRTPHDLFIRLPTNTSIIPEIQSFSPFQVSSVLGRGVRDATLLLVNGSTVDGFDQIIFATGFRRSNPFLADYHNSSIAGFDAPETTVPPILTDGTHLRSLHWTGHYIADPTLAFMTLVPWGLGPYQSLGLAKVWSQRAWLPSISSMWRTYPGPGAELIAAGGAEDTYSRLFVNWLNQASLELGGRLVSPLPLGRREPLIYFFESTGLIDRVSAKRYSDADNTPQGQWPVRNTSDSEVIAYGTEHPKGLVDAWLDWDVEW